MFSINHGRKWPCAVSKTIVTVHKKVRYFNVSNLDGDDAPGKMNYISWDSKKEQANGREQVPVHNRAGRPISDDEREQFLEQREEITSSSTRSKRSARSRSVKLRPIYGRKRNGRCSG